MGILSASQCELVRKFHCEGFQPEELRESKDGPSAIALYRRIQRAVHRLRRIGVSGSSRASSIPTTQDENSKNILRDAVDFSREMGIRNSEKGNSPEQSTASRKIFFEFSSCVVGMLLALDEPLTPIR